MILDLYNEQQGFIRKTYGIFSVYVLLMSVYVFYCQFNKDDGEFYQNVARSKYGLGTAITLAIGSLLTIILGMSGIQRKTPVNYILGFTFALSLSYIAGYLTIGIDINVVLTSFILTFVISILMAWLAPRILGAFGKKKQLEYSKAVGPTFGILGAIVVIMCLISMCNPWGSADSEGLGFKSGALMTLAFIMVLTYMLLDTYAIVNGKYCKMITKEDYIYASSKLFADFVLFFTLAA